LPTQLDELLQLLDRQDARVRRAFIEFVQTVRSPEVMAELIARLEANDLEGALQIVDSYVAHFGNVIPEVMRDVGLATAVELNAALPDIPLAIIFDASNPRAAALAAGSRTNLIRQMSGQQRTAISQAVGRAVSAGVGPQEMARTFRNSIGLTASQEAYVNSYRRQLETLNSRALDRALRDRRYDARFTRALERDRPLTTAQIDTMVDLYRARALAMRAETIGRTEALTAYSQAREESVRQMISQTGLSPNRVLRVWHSIHDDRVRAWHADMEGEKRPVDQPFVDGLGNSVMYPGDPLSPAETRINCRCTLGFQILPPN
jgi:hypothetical protein